MNNKVVSSKLSEMKIGNFVFLFLAKSVFGNVIKYKGSIASVAPTKFATASKNSAERLGSNNCLYSSNAPTKTIAAQIWNNLFLAFSKVWENKSTNTPSDNVIKKHTKAC